METAEASKLQCFAVSVQVWRGVSGAQIARRPEVERGRADGGGPRLGPELDRREAPRRHSRTGHRAIPLACFGNLTFGATLKVSPSNSGGSKKEEEGMAERLLIGVDLCVPHHFSLCFQFNGVRGQLRATRLYPNSVRVSASLPRCHCLRALLQSLNLSSKCFQL